MGNPSDSSSRNFRYIHLDKRDNVAIVRLDGPDKENLLGKEVSKQLHDAIESIISDKKLIGVVIMSVKPDSFLAGADIAMLEKSDGPTCVRLSQLCHKEFNRIENFRLPVVAAIMGTCMGGGLELILSCKYRICVDTDHTAFSMPEIRLGLIPAGGGTQRLPRKIMLPLALDMMLTGRALTARQAFQIGLVEQLINPIKSESGRVDFVRSLSHLEEVAVVAVRRIAENTLNVRSWYGMWLGLLNYVYSTTFVWNYLVKTTVIHKLMKSGMENMPAANAIIRCVETSIFRGVEEGYKMESTEFGRLIETREAKALIGLYHAINNCRKQRFGEASEISHVAVVGSSLAGMATVYNIVTEDLKATVIEKNDGLRIKAINYVKEYYKKLAERMKGRLQEIEAMKNNIVVTENYDALQGASIVLLALPLDAADEEIQEEIKKIEDKVDEHITIVIHLFGTSLENIVSKAQFPNRILAVSYGVPYGLSKYGEIIKHNGNDSSAIANAASLLVKQGLYTFVTKDSNETPGYYLVRCILSTLVTVCDELFKGDIRTASEMDKFTKNAGFIGGIAEMCDLFEIGSLIKPCQRYHFHCEHTLRFLQELRRRGRNGKASGKGFHIYANDKITEPSVDVNFRESVKAAQAAIETSIAGNWAADAPTKLLLTVTNTAIECCEKGIISEPEEGDVGCVFGAGFSPMLGGPFRYVSQRRNDIKKLINGKPPFCNLMRSHLYSKKKSFYFK